MLAKLIAKLATHIPSVIHALLYQMSSTIVDISQFNFHAEIKTPELTEMIPVDWFAGNYV